MSSQNKKMTGAAIPYLLVMCGIPYLIGIATGIFIGWRLFV